jgi:hypothetical protein
MTPKSLLRLPLFERIDAARRSAGRSETALACARSVYYAFRVTFLEAAEEILRSSRRPLTAAEITELAIERGLISTGGKAPLVTMRARLYTAPPDGRLRRTSERGPRRARNGTVRWSYIGPS